MERTIRDTVLAEYFSGGVTQRGLAKRYGVSKSSVDRWIQTHRGRVPTKMVPREIVVSPEMAKEVRDDLPEEVKELQRQLEQERLRVKLLTAIIDVAEEELKIPIRKKPGTKPSTESGTTKSM
jgi:transposase-like protein